MKIGKNVISITLMLFGLLFVSNCTDKDLKEEETPIGGGTGIVKAVPGELATLKAGNVPDKFTVAVPPKLQKGEKLDIAKLSEYADPTKKGNVALLKDTVKYMDESISTVKLAMVFADALISKKATATAISSSIAKDSAKLKITDVMAALGIAAAAKAQLTALLTAAGVSYDKTYIGVPASCYQKSAAGILNHHVRISTTKETADCEAAITTDAEKTATIAISWNDDKDIVQTNLAGIDIRYNGPKKAVRMTKALTADVTATLSMVDCSSSATTQCVIVDYAIAGTRLRGKVDNDGGVIQTFITLFDTETPPAITGYTLVEDAFETTTDATTKVLTVTNAGRRSRAITATNLAILIAVPTAQKAMDFVATGAVADWEVVVLDPVVGTSVFGIDTASANATTANLVASTTYMKYLALADGTTAVADAANGNAQLLLGVDFAFTVAALGAEAFLGAWQYGTGTGEIVFSTVFETSATKFLADLYLAITAAPTPSS